MLSGCCFHVISPQVVSICLTIFGDHAEADELEQWIDQNLGLAKTSYSILDGSWRRGKTSDRERRRQTKARAEGEEGAREKERRRGRKRETKRTKTMKQRGET